MTKAEYMVDAESIDRLHDVRKLHLLVAAL
jgi:hypothetical protein